MLTLFFTLMLSTGTLPTEPRAPRVYAVECDSFIRPKNDHMPKTRRQSRKNYSRRIMEG